MFGSARHIEIFREYKEGIAELEKLWAAYKGQDLGSLFRIPRDDRKRAREIKRRLCDLVHHRTRYSHFYPFPSRETFLCDVLSVRRARYPKTPETAFNVHYHRVDASGKADTGFTIRMNLGDFVRPRQTGEAGYWLHDPTQAFSCHYFGDTDKILLIA